MRKANRKVKDALIYKRISEAGINEYQRERALRTMQEAEAIVDAILWAREKIASLGGLFLKPGFKN